MINSKILTSEQVGYMSKEARLLYIGTLILADDNRKIRGNLAYLRSQIFPYDDDIDISDIKKWLDEMIKKELVVYYEDDGLPYLQHPNTSNETVTKPSQKRNIRKNKLSKDKLNEYKKDILAVWNVKAIIVHKVISKDASKEIEKLFGYPENITDDHEQVAVSIVKAISVYSKVLQGKEYWWSHKWNLYEFLKRGYKQFEGKTPDDYKGRNNGQSAEKI